MNNNIPLPPKENNIQTAPVDLNEYNLLNKKAIVAGIIIVLVFISVSALAFTGDLNLFSKTPYNQSNLVSGLYNKILEIDNASYVFSVTVKGEEREEGLVPISEYVGSSINNSLLGDGIKSLSEISLFLSEDTDINFALDLKTDIGEDKIDAQINVDAHGDFQDLTYKLNADLIKKDEMVYVKINNFPSLPFIPQIPKGGWISEKIPEHVTNPFLEEFIKHRVEVPRDLFNRALALVDENELIQIVSKPKKIDNGGKVAYIYNLELNKDAFTPLLQGILDEVKDENYEKIIKQAYITDIEKAIDYAESDIFQKVIEYYSDNSGIELIVDSEGFPVSVSNSIKVVPESVGENSFSSSNLDNSQFKFTSKLKIYDINETVEINAPANSKNFQEIMMDMHMILSF